VSAEFVKDGEIVLNVSQNATRDLTINNDWIQFSARFGGVSREVSIPVDRVQGIFARENGQGAFFSLDAPEERGSVGRPVEESRAEPPTPGPGRGRLKLVK